MTTKSHALWTARELTTLLDNPNAEDAELQRLLPRHTLSGIKVRRRRLGLFYSDEHCGRVAKRNRAQLDADQLCKVDQTLALDDLDNEVWQVLMGSLLGDGGLKRNTGGRNRFACRNYHFVTSHCDYQRTYSGWKRNKLSVFHPSRLGKRATFSTCSHPIFTELRPLFYSLSAKKRTDLIPACVMERLDLLGLLVWYLDDGSCGVGPGVRTRNPNFRIAAKSFGPQQLESMAASLNRRFLLHLRVGTSRWRTSRNYTLTLPRQDTECLMRLWRMLFDRYDIPGEMLYKIPRWRAA